MSEPMTFKQFRELVEHIDREHSPIRHTADKVRIVKYIDPHLDMRTGHVFSITFRGYSWEKNFHTMNEQRDLELSLLDRCMKYLDGEHDE